MAIAERLIIANYDSLDNKPIINQDLTALGFVPVANTYYRHTGNTTSSFTKGLIYKYDGTQFKELGTGQEVDLSHYIRVEDLAGLLPNVQYALVHNANNEFTLVEVEAGEGGTGWLIATNETEVNALLIDENLGKFFMYIGTPADELYAYALYQIVEQDGSIDKALVYISAEDISIELTAILDELSTKQDKATLEQDVADLGFTKNVGTVTGITMNGESKQVENGIVDLGTVITEHQELKTVNGESIVGEGNIQIDGVTDYDELENQPIINQTETRTEELKPFTVGQDLSEVKIHFNKDADIDAFLEGLTYPEATPGQAEMIEIMTSNEGRHAVLVCAKIPASMSGLEYDVYALLCDPDELIYVSADATALDPEFTPGWHNLDENDDFTLDESDTVIYEIVDTDPAIWNGVIVGVQEEVIDIQPQPVDKQFYKRDGQLYRYTAEKNILNALEDGQVIPAGDKIHFDKSKTSELDTLMNNVEYYQGQLILFWYTDASTSDQYMLGFLDAEMDNPENPGTPIYGPDAHGKLLVAKTGDILYATESGKLVVPGVGIEITYTQGFNSELVDANGDYILSSNSDVSIILEDMVDEELWNGVLIGIQEVEPSFYDKVVLESELKEGEGLPDSTNAKDGDTLRVKVTPEVVGFINPVEVVEGGTTNDIFINTNATIDFSKFNPTTSVSDILCEELIKLNFPAKSLVYGENLGDRLYKVYGDSSCMTDTNGTSIVNICSSYWNLVNNPQTDNNGFYFVEVLSNANDSQSKSPLRLYKFDNGGSDAWVLIQDCESSMYYDLYNNNWFWSSNNFSITVDGNTVNFREGDKNGSMSDSIYFNDDVQLAVSTSLFNNFLFVTPAFYFDIVAMNYDGVQMLMTLQSTDGENYDVDSEGIIWSSASIEEGMEPGWSPYLEYATGSHENGIISYLRGFLPLVTSGGESMPGEDDPIPNNITYVSSNPAVNDIFGSTRDTEVLSPEKKEIGWGLPFPDIKKAGQVLVTAGEEYALTYDNYQATHDIITAVDGFTFNTDLDQATVDANVNVLGMRAMDGLEPIKATTFSPYTGHGVAFTMAVPLANFEVGQTIGEYAGMFVDTSKVSELKAYLNSLGLTSGSADYPLLVVDDNGNSVNALYVAYDEDKSRTVLYEVGGVEVFNTDAESWGSESMIALPSGATITNIYDGSYWNGVFFYSFEESETSMKGAILGLLRDYNTNETTTEIMYSTVAGDAVIINMLASEQSDMYIVMHNLEHRWYEENFDLLNFSGICQFQIDSNYRGRESTYGVLVTLQPGVFYGDIANAHVEWGSSKVNPEDYETSNASDLYYLMGEGHNGTDLKRYNYNDVKSDISSYVQSQLPAMPTYRYGDFTLSSGNWTSYNDVYRCQYGFGWGIYDNDTLMIAPADATSAQRAQEANVYFAEPTYSGSSNIYFYASEQPQNDISFKYTFIDLN